MLIPGQQLIGVEWVTVSPLSTPFRALFFLYPVLLFVYLSLHFFRRVNSGSTIIVQPVNFLRTLRVLPGKHTLSKAQISHGYFKSYDGPWASAFLGLFLFTAAEILIVFLFKQPVYHILPPG